MKKDRAVRCPNCGSKNISKRSPAIDGFGKKTFIQFRGYYYCRDCGNITKVGNMQKGIKDREIEL